MTAQNTLFYQNKTIRVGGKIISLASPIVMGILNVTPDSFYSGSRAMVEVQILRRAEKMLSERADILDVGGYSSRPGAADISEKEEYERTIPAIRSIKKEFPNCILSVDTFRSEIAKKSVESGADMINDISGGDLDEKMMETVSMLHVPYILMHMRGTPQTMQTETGYPDILLEILQYFEKKISIAKNLGIRDLILDPGFGFAKTIEQNFDILRNLSYLTTLGYPLLAGISRKSMIYKSLGISPETSLNGTTVLNTIALQQRASILRVHDVKEAVETIKLTQLLN